jgi:hypothetical protein
MQPFPINSKPPHHSLAPPPRPQGKVVIDAFRLISPQTMMLGQEPRQTTSNLGALNKPSIQVRGPWTRAGLSRC